MFDLKSTKLYNFGIYDPLLNKKQREKVRKMVEEQKGKQPDYIVSTPVELKDKKTFWRVIGAAWVGDNGISVNLDALPANARLFLAKPDKLEKK